MTSFLDRLNLRPHERRFVVIGAVILFLLLNFWLIWPHYGDLGRTRGLRGGAQGTLRQYHEEFARTNGYLARLTELEKEGTGMLDADKDILFISTIQQQASRSGIAVAAITPAPRNTRTATNEFFEQRQLTIGLNPTPPEGVVSFLLSLADHEIVLRVKELDLKPDPSRTKLTGTIKVVASFQKKALVPVEESGNAVVSANRS